MALPSCAVFASFSSSGTPLFLLTYVRIGFQYCAVSAMLRWFSTLNAYACCAMAPGACRASAAARTVATRTIAFRIMNKLPSKRFSPVASNRHLQEQHRTIQHEERAHHPQHAFARDVQVHL